MSPTAAVAALVDDTAMTAAVTTVTL